MIQKVIMLEMLLMSTIDTRPNIEMLFLKIIFHRFDAKNNLSFTHEM